MIINLPRFAAAERPYWDELRTILDRRAADPAAHLDLTQIERFHYLYARCSADLAQLGEFAEPQLRSHLSSLVARAYCEIHESRAATSRPWRERWRELLWAFPRAFRHRLAAFQLAVAITIIGISLGAFALRVDPQAKSVIMPFAGLMGSPAERVAQEEHAKTDRLAGSRASFSAELMTHNIQVTLLTMASGLLWGTGTLVLLFYNGVILGAVGADYIGGGQAQFLLGWLLPHGSTEIPSILFGGQAGFVLAAALIGYSDRRTRSERLRAAAPDLIAIIGGAGVLLVWSGVVESYISQYHQPVLAYNTKIAFGLVESTALWLFLFLGGRR